ncbi:MAG: thioredoxin domain-containing protein [Candidatus Margulisbacteria bacterium]|nr:thioredoxin domain-containing protein [Candidatus Margulisiibacteriota bacterium]
MLNTKIIAILANTIPILKLPTARISREHFNGIPQQHLETFWAMFSEYPELLDEDGNINLTSDNFSQIYDWLQAKIVSTVKITITDEIRKFTQRYNKFSYSSSRKELSVKGEITEEEAGELESLEIKQTDKKALMELIRLSGEIIPGQEIYNMILKGQRQIFDKMILGDPGKTLVLFWQEGCYPCKSAIRQLDEHKSYLYGDIKIYIAAIEDNILPHKDYKDVIRGTPAFLYFEKGELQKTILGCRSMKTYAEEFDFEIIGLPEDFYGYKEPETKTQGKSEKQPWYVRLKRFIYR